MRFFKVDVVSGHPSPKFEGGDKEAWVREALLSESTTFSTEIMKAVTEGETSSVHPIKFSGNEIFLDVYPLRSIVTAQWLTDCNGTEYSIEMENNELKHLLSEWEAILNEHLKHSRTPSAN